jgi:CRP-like cAMP-binding protein
MFFGANETMDQMMSLPQIAGHVAMALLAVASLISAAFWTRVLAILAAMSAVLFFQWSGMFGQSGIAWSLAIVVLNLYQLYQLQKEQNQSRLPSEDAAMLRHVFSGLPDADIARLLRAGEVRTAPHGEVLTRQDAPLDSMFFLLQGRATVSINQSFVTYLEPGSFIGEIAYLTGNPATAHVVIEEESRLLVLNKVRIAKMMAADEHLSGVLHQVLGKDLAMKMRRSNTRRVLSNDASEINS